MSSSILITDLKNRMRLDDQVFEVIEPPDQDGKSLFFIYWKRVWVCDKEGDQPFRAQIFRSDLENYVISAVESNKKVWVINRTNDRVGVRYTGKALDFLSKYPKWEISN